MQALHDFKCQNQAKELTVRQAQVLELVAKRRTLKQIADELAISESAINQHIKALKMILKVNSLPELADTFRTLSELQSESTCRKSTSRISGLSELTENSQQALQNGFEPVVTFNDALHFHKSTPWEIATEPSIVPGVLNGTNAKLVRSALIVGISLGLFILILTGLGVAQGLTEAISR